MGPLCVTAGARDDVLNRWVARVAGIGGVGRLDPGAGLVWGSANTWESAGGRTMSLERPVALMAVAVALLVQACGAESKPIAPKLSLGMTAKELEREFPGIKRTSAISDGWEGMVSSVTVRDHHNNEVLLDEKTAEVMVDISTPGGASIHIRPQSRRPLRDVIAFLDKEIPALLSHRGWKEHTPFADHWYSTYENKCAPADNYKLVRWDLEVVHEFAPDMLEFAIDCDSLDLDSPASWFVTIRSGGGLLKTQPAVRGR